MYKGTRPTREVHGFQECDDTVTGVSRGQREVKILRTKVTMIFETEGNDGAAISDGTIIGQLRLEQHRALGMTALGVDVER